MTHVRRSGLVQQKLCKVGVAFCLTVRKVAIQITERLAVRESHPQGLRRMGRCRRGVGTGPYVFSGLVRQSAARVVA